MNSTDTGSAHKILDFLGFLSTCANAEPCVVFAAFLVPINWSAAPHFLGLLVSSTVLTPDWASVPACCRTTTRAPDWAGGHVMSSTVLTPDWASVTACCRATTRAPHWAGGHVMSSTVLTPDWASVVAVPLIGLVGM